MELRVKAARTTRDVNLAMRKAPSPKWDDAVIKRLLESAAGVDLQDGFQFMIGESTMDLDAAPYGGSRFPVEGQMAGRRFADFHLDVSAGDVLREPFEILEGHDWLGFANIPKVRLPAISREEQFAEKLHAYTLPRSRRPNTRVKDLVDMVLLLESGSLDKKRLYESVEATFLRRATHAVPISLPAPPDGWKTGFAELAESCGLDQEIDEQYHRLARFLNAIFRQGRA